MPNMTPNVTAKWRYIPSPNFDARPEHCDVELLVIHNISLPPNEYGGDGIVQLFTNQLNPEEHPFYATIHHLRVSAHFLIRRTGEVIQFVPTDLRAWHAGVSQWCDRHGTVRTVCNDFSVGIELEGCDTEPFTDAQYTALADVVAELKRRYPTLHTMTGHQDIAPTRKTDPGPYFDWERAQALCQLTCWRMSE